MLHFSDFRCSTCNDEMRWRWKAGRWRKILWRFGKVVEQSGIMQPEAMPCKVSSADDICPKDVTWAKIAKLLCWHEVVQKSVWTIESFAVQLLEWFDVARPLWLWASTGEEQLLVLRWENFRKREKGKPWESEKKETIYRRPTRPCDDKRELEWNMALTSRPTDKTIARCRFHDGIFLSISSYLSLFHFPPWKV